MDEDSKGYLLWSPPAGSNHGRRNTFGKYKLDYVSAKSFVNEFSENSASNIFPIFEDGKFERLENIEVPALAFYGSKEDTVIKSPGADLEIIARHLKNPKSKTLVIGGADHTYLNFESQIASSIADWIKEIS